MKNFLVHYDWANFCKGAMSLCFILFWGALLTASFTFAGFMFAGVVIFGGIKKIYE